MPFVTVRRIGGADVTVFPVTIRVPLSVSNSSRDNAIRTNVGKQLETMTLVQLEQLQGELEGLVLINPEWPICIAMCDSRSMAIISAGALLQATQGEVEFRKVFPGPSGAALEPGAPSVLPPAPPPPKPGPDERMLPSAKRNLVLWGVAGLLVVALVSS